VFVAGDRLGFGVLFLSCVCVSVSGVLFSVGVCVRDLLIFLQTVCWWHMACDAVLGLTDPLLARL